MRARVSRYGSFNLDTVRNGKPEGDVVKPQFCLGSLRVLATSVTGIHMKFRGANGLANFVLETGGA